MTKCIKCGGLSHFQASKLCPERSSKQATARKLEEAGDSDNEVSEESCGRSEEDYSMEIRLGEDQGPVQAGED